MRLRNSIISYIKFVCEIQDTEHSSNTACLQQTLSVHRLINQAYAFRLCYWTTNYPYCAQLRSQGDPGGPGPQSSRKKT